LLQAVLPDGIPIWLYFGGLWKCWFILCPFGIFVGHLVDIFVVF
jgi:hypothetical protein